MNTYKVKDYFITVDKRINNPSESYYSKSISIDLKVSGYKAYTETLTLFLANENLLNKKDLFETLNRKFIDILKVLYPIKSYRKFIFGRSRQLTKFVINDIHEFALKQYHISKEEYKFLFNLSKKIAFPIKKIKKNKSYITWNCGVNYYINCYSTLKSKIPQYQYIFSDLNKFEKGFLKFIIINDLLHDINSIEQWNNIVKNTPKYIKTCKYGLTFKKEFLLNYNFIPTNRYEYYLLSALHKLENGYISYQAKMTLLNCGKRAYDIWRKKSNIKGPYGANKFSQFLNYIHDSVRIYNNCRLIPDCEMKEPKGQGQNFIDILENIHTLESKYAHKISEYEAQRPLITDGILAKSEIEEYRIKTVGNLIKAGRECHHCIGSYKDDDSSSFYRIGDICAQVRLQDYNIVQCWDKYNRVTEESKRVEEYLTKELNICYQKKLKFNLTLQTREELPVPALMH